MLTKMECQVLAISKDETNILSKCIKASLENFTFLQKFNHRRHREVRFLDSFMNTIGVFVNSYKSFWVIAKPLYGFSSFYNLNSKFLIFTKLIQEIQEFSN